MIKMHARAILRSFNGKHNLLTNVIKLNKIKCGFKYALHELTIYELES